MSGGGSADPFPAQARRYEINHIALRFCDISAKTANYCCIFMILIPGLLSSGCILIPGKRPALKTKGCRSTT